MLLEEVFMTKKGRRKTKGQIAQAKQTLHVPNINPKNVNQSRAMNAFYDEQNLVLHGMAGTGKTFLSLYLTLSDVLSGAVQEEKVYVIRSCVPSRDIGFLPGSAKDKAKEYEAPYYEICSELFGRGDAYDILKQKKKLEFLSSSFLRGKTFRDCFVVVDEFQNMTAQELNTIITRVGKNCRIIFSGDIRQNDIVKGKSGIRDFLRILQELPEFSAVEFGVEDVVRSGMVKSYLLTRQKLEDAGRIGSLEKS